MGCGKPHEPNGVSLADVEAIDQLLTRAGALAHDGRGQPLTIRQRLELLLQARPDPFTTVSCDRCRVAFGRSPQCRDALYTFLTAHRHVSAEDREARRHLSLVKS